MSGKPIAVKFLKSWRGYSKGEVAGYSQDEAQRLVDGEVAEFVGKAPAKPKAKPGAAAGSQAGGEQGGAGDGQGDAGGDGQSGGDSDDEEEKP